MKRAALICLILFQVLTCAYYWHKFQIRTADFIAFYSSTLVLKQNKNPYDLNNHCPIQEAIRGAPGCLPTNHTPVLLALLWVFTTENYESSYWRWCAFLIAVLSICFIPLSKFATPENTILALLFAPTFFSVALGQDTVLILLGVLLWAWCLVLKKDWLAGIALGLTMVKPQITLQLGLPLLFFRPKAFVGFVATGIGLTIFSWLLVGTQGIISLIDVLKITGSGGRPGIVINQEEMCSVAGLLANVGINTRWAWLLFGASIVVLSFLWRKNVSPDTLALGITIAIFASPHLHCQELALMALPIVLMDRRAPPIAALLMMAALFYGAMRVEGFLLLFMASVLLLRKIR